MDDTFLMGRFHSLSNLATNFQSLFHRQRPFGNTLLQGFAWDQLQHQEMNVIRVLEAVNG